MWEHNIYFHINTKLGHHRIFRFLQFQLFKLVVFTYTYVQHKRLQSFHGIWNMLILIPTPSHLLEL